MQIDADTKATDLAPELAPINPLTWTVSLVIYFILVTYLIIYVVIGKRCKKIYWTTYG